MYVRCIMNKDLKVQEVIFRIIRHEDCNFWIAFPADSFHAIENEIIKRVRISKKRYVIQKFYRI